MDTPMSLGPNLSTGRPGHSAIRIASCGRRLIGIAALHVAAAILLGCAAPKGPEPTATGTSDGRIEPRQDEKAATNQVRGRHPDLPGHGVEVKVAKLTSVNDRVALRLTNGQTVFLQRPVDGQLPAWFKPEHLEPVNGSRCFLPPFPASISLQANQTPIRSQGGRDTCTVFATVAATEAAYHRLYGLDLDLSEQYLNHVQKAFWLNFNAPLPAPEIQPDTNGGGNLVWQALVLQRYGLPSESTLPYIDAGDYQNTPAGLDDPSITQKAMDDYELSAVSKPYTMPEPFTATIWPQSALEDARYRPTNVIFADGTQIQSLDWYRSQLACDREVMIQITIPPDSNLGSLWTPGNQSGGGVHAVLIVGYDDNQSAFLIKNSWGGTTLTGFSYDWITRGLVSTAGVVTDVAPPGGAFDVWNNKQLFLGRWSLDHDGWHGTLDLYRLPRTDGDSNSDWRVGTYFGPDGVARRVNAKINGNRIDFLIDWNKPDQAADGFDPNSALHFTGYIFSWDHLVIAGTMLDNRDGNTYMFHAQKSAVWTGTPATPTLGAESLAGTWSLEYDGWKGQLAISTVDSFTGGFTGSYTAVDGRQYSANGTVSSDPRKFTLMIYFGTQPQTFNGFLYGHELQFAAGTTNWENIPFGFAMVRVGDAAPPRNGGAGSQFHQCSSSQKCCEPGPKGSCARCISKKAYCP
jgi:hypothetical protein